MKKTVILLMSGGVDSAVSALLLKQAGYDVSAITMRLSEANDCLSDAGTTKTCCGISEVMDARKVCNILGIKHHYVDFSKQFKSKVIDKFIKYYGEGLTPVPCSDCNDFIKFGDCLEYCFDTLKADKVATGHYSSIIQVGDEYQLHRSLNTKKDQSYFLAGVRKDYLSKIVFPIADLDKEQVRQLARDNGFPMSEKRESMDICFAPKGYKQFLSDSGYQSKSGNIINESGQMVGTHDGIEHYTYGQKLNGKFVIRTNSSTGEVTIGNRPQSTMINLKDINILCDNLPTGNVTVKIRNRCEYECSISQSETGITISVTNGPFLNVTPGQSAVIYSGTQVILKGEVCFG